MGPTASGKSALAEALAEQLNAVLVNADAFQIYRGLDIGTAKPESRERYELLDIKNPDEGFGVGEFILLCLPILESAFAERRPVVVVGGTGFYIRALFEEYQDLGPEPDPEVRARIDKMRHEERLAELLQRDPKKAGALDVKNPVRVQRALERLDSPSTSLAWQLPSCRKAKFALEAEPTCLNERIAERVDEMIRKGWVEEVENLRNQGWSPQSPGFRAIGYRTLFEHVEGRVEIEEAAATIVAETRNYAKRQRTWLRSEPNLACIGAVRLDEQLQQVNHSLQ